MSTTHRCRIDAYRWMWSVESAYITITTPKGTTLQFDKWPKWNLKNKWDENAQTKELVYKIYSATGNERTGSIELTTEQVLLLKEYSNQQDKLLEKTKRQPTGGKDTCSCGTAYKTKDHGSWIGYFCPKCGDGGSRNKFNNNRVRSFRGR